MDCRRAAQDCGHRRQDSRRRGVSRLCHQRESPNLTMFDGIVPCGIIDRDVTSLAVELGIAPAMDAVSSVVAERFCDAVSLSPLC